MTADRFSPIDDDDDPDRPSRLRQAVTLLFVVLFTVFLFEAMDGVQRAAEQAERREDALRATCRDPAWEIEDPEDNPAPVELNATTMAAATDLAATHSPTTHPVSVPVTPVQFTHGDPPAHR